MREVVLTPGMPGAVLTTVYYLFLVAAMPVVVLVRWLGKRPTQAASAVVSVALVAGCVAVGLVIWRLFGAG